MNLPTKTCRVPLIQTASWTRGVDRGFGAYDTARCCVCGRKVTDDAQFVRVVRSDDGAWWIKQIGEPTCDDEHQLGETTLPVGPDCLKKHPEFHIGFIAHE